MTIDSYITETMPKLEGWCTPEKARALAECVQKESPQFIIEIGVFGARSLIAMALADTQTVLIGIDPWASHASVAGFENDIANKEWWEKVDHTAIYDGALSAVFDCGVHSRTYLVRFTSQEALAFVRRLPRPIGLLHIDGNHSEEYSTFDVQNYVPLVKQGGIVVFDDTNWTTTAAAQQLLLQSCDLEKVVEAGGQACGFFRKR